MVGRKRAAIRGDMSEAVAEDAPAPSKSGRKLRKGQTEAVHAELDTQGAARTSQTNALKMRLAQNARREAGALKKRLATVHVRPPLKSAFPSWFFALSPAATLALFISALMFSVLFLDVAFRNYAVNMMDRTTHNFFYAITDLGKSEWKIILSAIVTTGFAALGLLVSVSRSRASFLNAAILSAFVFVSISMSGLLVAIVKRVIGRARPKLYETEGIWSFSPLSSADFASIPSGHSTTIFAAGIALAFVFPKLKWAFFAFMWWVAMSRVFIVQHWFSDVLTAFFFALGIVCLLRWWLASHRLGFEYLPKKGIVIRSKRSRKAMTPTARDLFDRIAPKL